MEARVRVDFLNPFFSALGWDVTNTKGLSEHEREVVTESRLKTSAGLKFPDYVFQHEGKPIFPVEAKRPSVNLKSNPAPALQLRRYAWNAANLGVGILTDFQEFAVYDCRIPPAANDPASKALIDYYTVDDYPQRWSEIYHQFSYEAVTAGALAEYVSGFKGARGKQRVDRIFLSALENWRMHLAVDLAKKNQLSQEEINTAVQLVIDRIVFLRVAEDRGLERYGDLRDTASLPDVYKELQALFVRADQKYNSGLFRFVDEDGTSGKDELTPRLTVGNSVLDPFIRSLYWPEGPYDFQVFPPDVLGQVYEQFLGHVIYLKSPRRAVVEEKPEVRKAKGIYYTPTHVVATIVRATLEPLLQGETPLSVERRGLRICDPACGSGSFLIEVYQQLLNWHLKYYVRNGPKWSRGRNARIQLTLTGGWRLTTSERKRILLNHVYGVDIDPQAVEVTKLSLLLKVLEGETEASIYEQTALFHDRVLPNLDSNVKSGNSLVGNAIHFSSQHSFDQDFERRVNAFDWDIEFPSVTAGRGFDAVVGNPPWLMAGYYVADSIDYLREHFKTATGKFDLYYLFIEQALRILAPGGHFGLIVPNKMFHTRAAKVLREVLATKADLTLIRDFGTEKIFSGATNYSCILLGRSQQPTKKLRFERLTKDLTVLEDFSVDTDLIGSAPWNFQDETARALFAKLSAEHQPLETFIDRFGTGVQTGSDKLLTFELDTAKALGLETQTLVRLLRGRDVRAYVVNDKPKLMLFPYKVVGQNYRLLSEEELRRFPRTYAYLTRNREALASRIWFDQTATELSGAWYGLMYVEQCKYVARPHLLTPALSGLANFAIGTGSLFATGTAGVTSLVLKNQNYEPEFFLALLNCPVVSAWVRSHSPVFQGGYRKFSGPYLKAIPVPSFDLSSRDDRRKHDGVVVAAKRVLAAIDRVGAATSSDDKVRARRQLAAARKSADDAAMELYDLTAEERQWALDKVNTPY